MEREEGMRTRSIKKQFWLNEQENETLTLN